MYVHGQKVDPVAGHKRIPIAADRTPNVVQRICHSCISDDVIPTEKLSVVRHVMEPWKIEERWYDVKTYLIIIRADNWNEILLWIDTHLLCKFSRAIHSARWCKNDTNLKNV